MNTVWLSHQPSIKIVSGTTNSYSTVTLQPLTVENGEQDIYIWYSVLKIYVDFAWTTCTQLFTSISIQIVLAWSLAQQREMVSWPPKKMCSTATAKPALCQKEEICNNHLFTHQEYIRYHKWDNINLETELADLLTTRLDHMHQNLPEEAWSTLQAHWLLAYLFSNI